MRNARVLTLALVAASMAGTAAAGPIVSGDGESWTSMLSAVCEQVGSGSPCGGVTVAVDPHPAWQDQGLTFPVASWVSYADTGYQGSVLAPHSGSGANPAGQTAIMELTESFIGQAGSAVSVRFWADDTLAVYFNDVLMKSAIFSQGTCADQPIGCETNEYWDLNATSTGGVDILRLVAFQVGNGTDTSSNPFGVLYAGSFVEPPTAPVPVPEPVTLSMLAVGLAGIGAKRLRRR